MKECWINVALDENYSTYWYTTLYDGSKHDYFYGKPLYRIHVKMK